MLTENDFKSLLISALCMLAKPRIDEAKRDDDESAYMFVKFFTTKTDTDYETLWDEAMDECVRHMTEAGYDATDVLQDGSSKLIKIKLK